LFLLLFGLTPQTFASQKTNHRTQTLQKHVTKLFSLQTPSQKQQVLVKLAERQKVGVEKLAAAARLDRELQRKVQQGIPAGEKIAAFIREIKRQEAMGKSRHEIYTEINTRLSLNAVQGTGQIQGSVTVGGQTPDKTVAVLAFDVYGYPAGTAEINWDNSYTISGLAPGHYFVLTESDYVDEFYNDVVSNQKKGWRSATLVEVTDGGTVAGIDFDLQPGAVISGHVYQADGTTPMTYGLVSISVFSATEKEQVTRVDAFTDANGAYSITLGMTGQFKLQASSYGYESQFYDHKNSWNEADVVTVSSIQDTLQNVDFTLTEGNGVAPNLSAGAISGHIVGNPGAHPLSFVLVVAFDLSDTSVAGLSISSFALMGGEVNPGDYLIAPLKAGRYVVYANDLMGPYGKAYFNGSATPAGATPVQVAEQDTTTGIDFALSLGGIISGTITLPDGNPADSVLVIALRADILDEDKFFSNADLGFTFTGDEGHYMIAGLSSGDYIVRTVALANSEYKNVALDEWYSDVHSIWDWQSATHVTVTAPRMVQNIDFALESPGFITGTVTNSDGSTPLGGTTLLALRTDTKFPELAFGNSDGETGNYSLGPLPAGDYFVFALPEDDAYLPEFYDGARLTATATAVSVTPPTATGNINFTLDKGATIEGFVYLQGTYPAGADTLSDFPVVAYDATSGIAMGVANITFSGGYRIENLPPGNYKVQALPVVSPFASTYFGGGVTFDDPSATAVSVGQNEVKEANIELGRGQEAISGHVYAEVNGSQDPLPITLVLAYDATGHAVSAGMSGVSFPAMTPLADSSVYTIANLRAGHYTVRTFSVISALESLGNLLNNMDNGENLETPGTGLGDGMPGLPLFGDLNLSITLYQDEWYNDVPVQMDPAQTGMDLLWSILTSKGDMTGFIPLFDQVPTGASAVSTGSTDIDFVLGKLNPKEIFSDVQQHNTPMPQAYALEQSYPNPVHLNSLISSGAVIAYSLKNPAPVSIAIYNVLGQKVAELVNRVQSAGVHRTLWNGKDMTGRLVANGIYFYELKVQNRRIDLKKMVILR
jgi:hypothetical protein